MEKTSQPVKIFLKCLGFSREISKVWKKYLMTWVRSDTSNTWQKTLNIIERWGHSTISEGQIKDWKMLQRCIMGVVCFWALSVWAKKGLNISEVQEVKEVTYLLNTFFSSLERAVLAVCFTSLRLGNFFFFPFPFPFFCTLSEPRSSPVAASMSRISSASRQSTTQRKESFKWEEVRRNFPIPDTYYGFWKLAQEHIQL